LPRSFINVLDLTLTDVIRLLWARENGDRAILLEASQDGPVTTGVETCLTNEEIGFAIYRGEASALIGLLDFPEIKMASVRFEEMPAHTNGAYTQDQATEIEIHTPRVARERADSTAVFFSAETGLDDLRRLSAHGDGRGVTVALVDDGFDVLHPAAGLACSVSGEPLPKLRDVTPVWGISSYDQVAMDTVVDANDDGFVVEGALWKAPHVGRYRFGVMRRQIDLGSKPVTIEAGVLWETESGRLWVDTNHERAFSGPGLRDFGVAQEFGWFGATTGSGDHRVPFYLKVAPTGDALVLHIPNGHGDTVGGAMAAEQSQGGLFNGAAPGVQIIDVPYREFVAAPLAALANPDVDVVNMAATCHGEHHAFAIARAIAVFDKPFVMTAGSIPGAIQVWDYQSSDMLRRNRGIEGPFLDAVNSWLTPDETGWIGHVLAPSICLAPETRYSVVARFPRPPAPTGYGVGSNQSNTIGYVSGLIASVIAAARAEGIAFHLQRLSTALFASCRPVEGIPLSVQGHGVLNAANALGLLRMMRAADGGGPCNRFSVARLCDGVRRSVHGYYGTWLTPTNYSCEQIWLTRTGGPPGVRRYRLGVKGDEAVISTEQNTLELERDTATPLVVHLHPRPGDHLTFLSLIDEAEDVVVHYVPFYVRAPDIPCALGPGEELYRHTIAPRRVVDFNVALTGDAEAVLAVSKLPFSSTRGTMNWVFNVTDMTGERFAGVDGPVPRGLSVAARTHVGDVETLQAFVPIDQDELGKVRWCNASRPEYQSAWDGPAPHQAITGELHVKRLRISTSASDANVVASNLLAACRGGLVQYAGPALTHSVALAGKRLRGVLEIGIEAPIGLWRLAFNFEPKPSPKPEPIAVVVLVMDEPSGQWKVEASRSLCGDGEVMMRNVSPGLRKVHFLAQSRSGCECSVVTITEARLREAASELECERAHGVTWTVKRAEIDTDEQLFVAFRIVEVPSNPAAEIGLRRLTARQVPNG
jgi:hypothetical protein